MTRFEIEFDRRRWKPTEGNGGGLFELNCHIMRHYTKKKNTHSNNENNNAVDDFDADVEGEKCVCIRTIAHSIVIFGSM